jgi:hypothetical protein
MKLFSYFEDDSIEFDIEAELNAIDEFKDDIYSILQQCDIINVHQSIPESTKEENTCQGIIHEIGSSYGISIPKMEKTKDGKYVMTKKECIALVIYGLYHHIAEWIEGIPKQSKEPVEREVCEFSGNLYFTKNTFSINEIRYLILELCGNNSDKVHALRKTQCYKQFMEKHAATLIQGLTSMDEKHYSYLDDQNSDDNLSHTNYYLIANYPWLDDGRATTEQHKEPNVYIYKNIITSSVLTRKGDIKTLAEYQKISDVNMVTDIGTYILERIGQVSEIDADHIVSDITKCLNIMSVMYKNIPEFKHIEKELPSKQRILTSYYVDHFKDENAETAASMVIEKVNGYLSTYMTTSEINTNQISTDLVDLGVHKLRKARGNVYKIKDPNKSELQQFMSLAQTYKLSNAKK